MQTIVFNKDSRDFVLSVFDKHIDDDGYIVENTTNERVLNPFGEEVKACDFAGFTPGSEIVLTKDLPALLQYANREE